MKPYKGNFKLFIIILLVLNAVQKLIVIMI